MKVMQNPNRIYGNLREVINLAWKPCFFWIWRSVIFMLEEVFLAVTLFYLFILESSSFGCAWFDIFKDIMIHIDR